MLLDTKQQKRLRLIWVVVGALTILGMILLYGLPFLF